MEDLDINEMLSVALTYRENNLDKILMQTEHLIYLLSRLIEVEDQNKKLMNKGDQNGNDC